MREIKGGGTPGFGSKGYNNRERSEEWKECNEINENDTYLLGPQAERMKEKMGLNTRGNTVDKRKRCYNES